MGKRLESMLSIFGRTTTGVLFVTAVFISIFYGWEEILSVKILWQILLLSGICTLGSFIIPMEEGKTVSRRGMLICQILFYVYVNIVVLLFGYLAQWFKFSNARQVFGMMAAIFFVYIMVTVISYWQEYRVAERMNQKLKERQHD